MDEPKVRFIDSSEAYILADQLRIAKGLIGQALKENEDNSIPEGLKDDLESLQRHIAEVCDELRGNDSTI